MDILMALMVPEETFGYLVYKGRIHLMDPVQVHLMVIITMGQLGLLRDHSTRKTLWEIFVTLVEIIMDSTEELKV